MKKQSLWVELRVEALRGNPVKRAISSLNDLDDQESVIDPFWESNREFFRIAIKSDSVWCFMIMKSFRRNVNKRYYIRNVIVGWYKKIFYSRSNKHEIERFLAGLGCWFVSVGMRELAGLGYWKMKKIQRFFKFLKILKFGLK